MLSTVLSKVLGWIGGDFLDKVLGHLEARANSETERMKIRAAAEANAREQAVKVITTGMQHRAFWVAWSIAAVPTAAWFGWGMLDSLCNGALPDVAALPPQLLRYADVVFANIFYSGAVVGGAGMIANAIRGR